MAIEVLIGQDRRAISDARPDWINRELVSRRQDGQAVCVRVYVDVPGCVLNLRSSACPSGGNGAPAAAFTGIQREIIDLWCKHGLDEPDFTTGNLEAFLKQLVRKL